MLDTADTTDQVELWLEILRAANATYDQLPPSIRDEIDAAASPRELGRMALHLATLSTYTRHRIEATLCSLLGREMVSRPSESFVQLRLVGQEAG